MSSDVASPPDNASTLDNDSNDMKLCVDSETYTILFRQSGLVGRTTCAVAAKVSNEMGPVVVKIVERRQSEVNLRARARDYANDHEGHQWALNPHPKIFASVEFPLAPQSVLCESITSTETKWAGGKTLFYESRITVFEKLHSLLEQVQPSAQAQIFFDVLQAHKWLYDHAHILHRDISMSNIMYRIDENGDCFGVLKDFDLASLRDDLESDTAHTSAHRTGTPPFMAMDFQNPYTTAVRHLYRHDLESLFYVLVMLVVRYKIQRCDGPAVIQLADNRELEHWFDAQVAWPILREYKRSFCLKTPRAIKRMIQPDFGCFQNWVTQLQGLFSEGIYAGCVAQAQHDSVPVDLDDWFDDEPATDSASSIPPKPAYNDETLGDYVTYRTFGRVMRRFGGTVLKQRYYHVIKK